MKHGIGLAGVVVGLVGLTNVAWGQGVTDEEILNERLADIEERLDQVEKRTILDRISLTGDYRTIYNSYIYDDGRGNSDVTEELWSHRLRINFKAEPLESVRVTARLAMYKHFGDNDSPAFVPDFERSRLPRDSIARFDQAWIDWFVTDWMAISAGRIAYAEGPPADLQNNNPVRQATWGTPIVDGEYDSVNVTFKIPEAEVYLRLYYASYFYDNPDDDLPFLDDGTDSLRVFGGNVEFSIPALGRNLFQFGYIFIPKWTLYPTAFPDPAYDPEADFRNAPGALSSENIFPSKTPESFGSWQTLAGLIILYDMFDSGLDFFISGSVGFINPSREGVEYEIPSPSNPDGPRESTPLLFFAGSERDGQVVTSFFYTGFRYALPIEALNEPKIGFEFNMGSRYLISLQQATDRLVSKLETRGYAMEAYLLLPVTNALFLRGGYLFIQRDYAFTFAGLNPALDPSGSTAPPVDEQLHNFSVTLGANL